MIHEVLEWIGFVVDLVGIGILLIGFTKGVYVFLKKELDSLSSEKTLDDVFSLRCILGGYIILSLDFLIISDIVSSIIDPELNDLIKLGIIVLLRTSIGFFLGRDLMELHHSKKASEALNTDEGQLEHKTKKTALS